MLLGTHSLVPDLAWLAPVPFVSMTCSMLECVVHLQLQMKEREKGTMARQYAFTQAQARTGLGWMDEANHVTLQ
ncbi:hypothetical protein HU200_058831 [Digitaria exilis]|uniref:Uncharacterized protein n=1 Tax=Digitaria exilis TaxID=1010633 RepID=A0A835A932_9POAL|nr:hypothetical protein HU200_058831 [Digitaria exilis]